MVAALMLVLLAGSLWTVGCGPSESGLTTTTSVATTTGPVATTATTATTTTTAKLDKLTLVAPPGPMAIPLAYMKVNNKLADVANKTELVIWENGDQLKAIVAGGQGDFVTIPSNTMAIFYNKGLALKMLDISVWNITYLVTSDPTAKSFSDIKGQSLAVSLQGSVPDVMFQYIAKKEGLDPLKDFDRKGRQRGLE
jgi:NitT/TauT family transport system substrate-binding protein